MARQRKGDVGLEPWYSGTMRALGSEGSPSARVQILSTCAGSSSFSSAFSSSSSSSSSSFFLGLNPYWVRSNKFVVQCVGLSAESHYSLLPSPLMSVLYLNWARVVGN
ncbi:hypothetical protein E2C01_039385 [Portunus trituberculatus]|uniref:Uncharacterized protein n=1 Tax=Portunus trituberculatus TaxID=210409 RepID=A0A5B7FKM3_PORTR|nr:hypothetical protein [Portunus trituberculatus]